MEEEWNKGTTDTPMDKVEETRQRTKAESSLWSLQQRLAYDTTTGFQPTNDASYGKERQMGLWTWRLMRKSIAICHCENSSAFSGMFRKASD
ncbi:hypothetical protein MUK42_06690 [Musa troglodytarum]|uniref:Uncharacterized protein n=1 Tax=Musa troglodytarum TaxID=320322 RepID=A0A9E7H0N0_9LILI|nr:hypothetical protein MUK42_06690 [Musa troglodytarum]